MGVQKERKITFLTAFEHREKEARSLFAAQYWYRSCLWMSFEHREKEARSLFAAQYGYRSCLWMSWDLNNTSNRAVSRDLGSAGPLTTKPQATPNWNMKHYTSVEFLSNMNVKPPCTNVRPPIHDFLVTVLLVTTFMQTAF